MIISLALHIIDENFSEASSTITIINKNTQDTKAIFDYVEICRYLEINNGQSPESPTHLDSDILSM